jgi:hypothetical protein
MLRYNTLADMEAHISFIFENDRQFFEKFMKLDPDDYDLTEISFSSTEIKVNWWHLDSGNHIVDSYPLAKFNTWLEEMRFRVIPDITAAMIKELREKTQDTLMNCKKALTACDGNM